MRTLCPNLDREDGLETVLEVPIPEEMFGAAATKNHNKLSWQRWMRSHGDKSLVSSRFGDKSTEMQLLLGVVGAPLIPLPIRNHHSFNGDIQGHPIEASMAKYIVQQYVAAAGGDYALNAIDSMYAMGKVKMATTEVMSGDGLMSVGCNSFGMMKMKNVRSHGSGEMGGFVLWQKTPDLWSLELVVSGCKIGVGCDGKMAWRQTPWHHSHASRGPARPLRRSLQGLDPRSTANLFSNSICIGEKTINGEDCFVLKLEADSPVLKSRSSTNVEVIRHAIWGYFSQRTGLLVQLEDSHLLRIKSPGNDEVFWETTMESSIQDYRTIDGVNIAHAGRTSVSLIRYGEDDEGHTRTRMDEVWSIEEVDFNVKGLSTDFFLPPADIKRDEEAGDVAAPTKDLKDSGVSFKIRANPSRFNAVKSVAKVAAIDEDALGTVHEDEDL